MNIHFHIDSTYTQEVINFINSNFSIEKNLHIITERRQNLTFVKPDSFTNIYSVDMKNIKETNKLKRILSKLKGNYIRCFYHYLSNDAIILTHLLGLSQKERNWILWGADLYAYIDYNLYSPETKIVLNKNKKIENSPINRVFRSVYHKVMLIIRKKFLQSLDKIMTWNKGDYELACEHYQITPQHIECSYNFGLKKNLQLKSRNKDSKEKIILVGNSGDPSNNHIDIYKALANIEGEFKVLSFLTYGNPVYIEKIIDIGYEILGAKFIPITDHMNREDYFNFIEAIDVVIMNHYRQQGVGNIVAFLQKGKKVYMNDFVTTFEHFKSNGVKVFSISEMLDVLTIDELLFYDSETEQSNAELIYDLFSDDVALKTMKNIFD